jgi:hypothetical protein
MIVNGAEHIVVLPHFLYNVMKTLKVSVSDP